MPSRTGQGTWNTTIRSSQSFRLPQDPVVERIRSRAAEFQGLSSPDLIEPLQVVQYRENEQYAYHFDWGISQDKRAIGQERETTFFVYLNTNCTNCGTHFPELKAPDGAHWCTFVDCSPDMEAGVTFKPIAGNAIFWQNVKNGVGDPRTIHSGLQLSSGYKFGLNIWTRIFL